MGQGSVTIGTGSEVSGNGCAVSDRRGDDEKGAVCCIDSET